MQVLSPAPYLSVDERNALSQKNDLKAIAGIIYHWAWIILTMALVYNIPNVATITIALFVIGGKQLAAAILMHDAGHYAVLENKYWNDVFGNWFGGYPVMQNLSKYRDYHLVHHLNTGLSEDPDLLLTRGYPSNRKSMFRKFWRDLSGQTGTKAFLGLILMHMGYLKYNQGGIIVKVDQTNRSWSDFFLAFRKDLLPCLIAQFILITAMTLFASTWLYLLWVVSYFTTFQLSLRVRAMAEHSMVDDSTDPYRNTRTTYANWFAQLLFAPYHVNYHVEHHMMMSVPSYNLPKMHHLLKAKGFYQKGLLAPNYWSVIKQAAQVS